MAYYTRENLPPTPVLGERRPVINEFFLSSYSLVIYGGCEFGCPYCDVWSYSSRPINESVRIPLDLPQRLAEELTRVDRKDLIGITMLSDCYQPAERTYRVTRQVLQMFADIGQPCLILTKGVGVTEDIPLLKRINERSLGIVMTTLITMDPRVTARIEGKTPLPALRLEALKKLKNAGIPVGVVIAPVIPYINDTTPVISALLRACAEVPVDFVVWDFLNIPDRSHFSRVSEAILRIRNYPPGYYRDLYGNQPLPSKSYRTECSADFLDRCDRLNLPVRAPHLLFAGKIKPANEAALFLKHIAYRDAVQGRQNIADLHRQLANRIYQEQATDEELRGSPFYLTLQEILGKSH